MKAIRVHQFGGPEVLQLQEIPRPQPAADQVLVRIYAAGVNPSDTYRRSGSYEFKPALPYTPGSDAAGVVEAIGDSVAKVRPGDRVYLAKPLSGTYAEFALALEIQVHPLPSSISYTQGAALWVPYGSAYHALFHCVNPHAGETALIHGASGGVGIAAIQMARALGLTVFGTAGTDRGLDLVKREGAHRTFNHGKSGYAEQILTATEGRGVDLILEMLADVNLGQDLKLLARRGRVVVIGSRGDAGITPRDLMTRSGSIHAFTLPGVTEAEEEEIHAGLFAGLENGTLRPVIGKELPLVEAPRAHREILEPGAYGKLVLIP
jgi:NADPH:quinone reductase